MLTQDQIETMRAIADKTQEVPGYDRVRVLPVWAWTSAWNGKAWKPVLTEAGREVLALTDRLKLPDGPTDPTAPQDLADALTYADEIDRDTTPPTSATHRWLIVLARALRATGKERDRLSLELDEAAKNWVSMEVEISKSRRENAKLKEECDELRLIQDALLKLEADLVAHAAVATPESLSMWYAPMGGTFYVESAAGRRAVRDRLIPAILWWANEVSKPERAPEHQALTERCAAAERERDEARVLADSNLRDLQGAQERPTTLGDALAKAWGEIP